MNTMKPQTLQINVGNEARTIAIALARGARVWGGLVSVTRSNHGSTYCLVTVASDGTKRSAYHGNEYNATWAFLQETGGNVTVTIQEPSVDTAPELLVHA